MGGGRERREGGREEGWREMTVRDNINSDYIYV